MNLEKQRVNGENEIHLTDSLNSALLGLKIINTSETNVPENGDLFVYVDKSPSSTPTDERKTYLFNLRSPLRKVNDVSDEFISHIVVENNRVLMKALVNRKIEVVDDTFKVMDKFIEEEVDNFPLTLFEGENYIYTNYSNANIELIYPQNNDLNLSYLNNAIYYQHGLDNNGEFCLDDIYFKDAFTKTEDKLNMEIDNINVDNITSKNNKFSLDSEGNLTVNSITANSYGKGEPAQKQFICDLIYPIGSIYMSVNEVTPSTLFGGTWEKINDRFLLGAGDLFNNGNIGGSSSVTLTEKNLPEHDHPFSATTSTAGAHSHSLAGVSSRVAGNWNGVVASANASDRDWQTCSTEGEHSHTVSGTTGKVGSSEPFDNMPPYLVVNIWKRTA